MKIKRSIGDCVFSICNGIILIILALLCLIPFIHMLSVSLSSPAAATAGEVSLWPIGFSTAAYKYALDGIDFLRSFWNSIIRVVLGVALNLILIVITAYPLSKSKSQIPGRSVLSWFFIITMLIGGGMIPMYLVVVETHIINTIWALILPGAVTAFNLTVVLNFFRGIPKGLEESALIDGASHLRILISIYIPLSVPILATMIVFFTVGHWNEWFSGMIYLNTKAQYPLMTYLQSVITTPDYSTLNTAQLEELSKVCGKTYQAAQILIATVPILIIYPICQKHFVKGMTLGSMKG
ncbi:MAG: carbohydrate ABC transporter permease [Oscillospiraceae bacterium]